MVEKNARVDALESIRHWLSDEDYQNARNALEETPTFTMDSKTLEIHGELYDSVIVFCNGNVVTRVTQKAENRFYPLRIYVSSVKAQQAERGLILDIARRARVSQDWQLHLKPSPQRIDEEVRCDLLGRAIFG